MHRIDTPTAQVDKFGAGKNGFTRGNPQTGVPATALDDDYFDAVQEELAGIVDAAGISLDKSNRAQVLEAIRYLIAEGIPELKDASLTQKGIVQLSNATNSNSEILAATPKAVSDLGNLLLKIGNNLSEIKDAGPAAVAQTLLNLGLGDVAHLPQLTGIVGASRNAKMSIPAASVAATFTADELIVQTGWGGRQYKLSGFSRSINLSTTGSGGMDIGTAPATGYVALYAIYNPTSGATALLAVNATSAPAPKVYGGANMPAGYTASALISVWGTSSGQFVVGHQIGRHIGIISNQLYSTAGSVLGYSGISLATAVPPNGKKANMQIVASQTTPNSVIQLYLASTAEGVGAIYVNASANSSSATTTSTNSGYAELDIIGVQTLYFKMANAVAATYTFICGGYEI
ncbi:tail fiber protein [Yersinia enterocolitica]|uniref:tail fiber protein n=1 Tax=Yersinia enterocolitica TaxID=630 RepID=UPI000327EB20|nr:phage tail protein [Yersinia enterocolitica]CCV45099.1 putative phage protein [Yersinia enterocolitica (type O:5,27) str. YE149/02]